MSAELLADQDFTFRRFETALGAEILDLDLSRPLDDATFAAVRRAFLASEGVLVFRDQRITPAQHVEFSRRFGKLLIHVLRQYAHAEQPEILLISNVIKDGKPVGIGDAGRDWHSDLSYVAVPSLGSLLHAQELPPEGGDTMFANMYAAYDALPDAIKRRIKGLQAVHSYEYSYNRFRNAGSKFRPQLTEAQKAEVPDVTHPIVRTHPETGRKALFVNEGFTSRIAGIPDEESRELLDFLFRHSVEDRFTYRHQWRDHDLVFWDNRCAMHKALGCPPHLRRHMHRTTVSGDKPF